MRLPLETLDQTVLMWFFQSKNWTGLVKAVSSKVSRAIGSFSNRHPTIRATCCVLLWPLRKQLTIIYESGVGLLFTVENREIFRLDRETVRPWDRETVRPWDRETVRPWDGIWNQKIWSKYCVSSLHYIQKAPWIVPYLILEFSHSFFHPVKSNNRPLYLLGTENIELNV